MSQFPTFKNPNPTPIAEIHYELPYGDKGPLELITNPVITINYANGEKSIYDTNLIYKQGYAKGKKDAEDSIKRKLGLK
jgi:hypothetical protein